MGDLAIRGDMDYNGSKSSRSAASPTVRYSDDPKPGIREPRFVTVVTWFWRSGPA